MIQPKNIPGNTLHFTGYSTRNKCAQALDNLGIYFGLNQAFRVLKAGFSISSLTKHTDKKVNKIFSYIRKFRVDRVQSHI